MTLAGGYLVFEPLTATFAQQAYWRLVTPMLLHFSWLHLAFNLLWVWELGRRIEKLHGISLFLAVTLLGIPWALPSCSSRYQGLLCLAACPGSSLRT